MPFESDNFCSGTHKSLQDFQREFCEIGCHPTNWLYGAPSLVRNWLRKCHSEDQWLGTPHVTFLQHLTVHLQVNCILNFTQFVFNQLDSLKTKRDAYLIWHFIASALLVTNSPGNFQEMAKLILVIKFVKATPGIIKFPTLYIRDNGFSWKLTFPMKCWHPWFICVNGF